MAPTLFTPPSAACNTLPPEGALRLRPGKAGSAAPAGLFRLASPRLCVL